MAPVLSELDHLAGGNFGDSKHLGGGISELQIDWGPEYRVYYAMIGKTRVLLLCGATNRPRYRTLKEQLNTGTTPGKAHKSNQRQ